MLPTTAFYHGPNQNVKSLLSNIPTLSSSLANISLTGYFQPPPPPQHPQQQQQKQQEPRISLVEIPSNDPTAPQQPTASQQPTAPQQPTHINRRARKVPHKQQQSSVSASIAATAPPRVVAANNNNMGNTIAAQPSRQSSTPNVSSSSLHHRRRKNLNKINRKKVDEAITLSAFAVEEDNQGNHDVATEFYLSAIENMLEALPIQSNQARKDALKSKLRNFMDREGLADEFMESTNTAPTIKATEKEESVPKSRPGISQHIIQAAITSAVALKQSPIPDAISATVNYTKKKIQKIDEAYGLQDKAWEISRTGINMALEIDQQYNVHEKVSNALFVGIAAAMKAGIAYKDSPSYRELQKMQAETSVSSSSRPREES